MSSSLVLHYAGRGVFRSYLSAARLPVQLLKLPPQIRGTVAAPHFYLRLVVTLDDLRGEVLEAQGRVERRLDAIKVRRQGGHAPTLRDAKNAKGQAGYTHRGVNGHVASKSHVLA